MRLFGHRQTKEAATDKPSLKPPRHISTLPDSARRQSAEQIRKTFSSSPEHSVREDRRRASLSGVERHSVEISDAVDNIVSNQLSSVSGVLRLSAPPSISDSLLAPLVGAFQASYPNVRVQIFVTDRFVDHIAEGVNLVFRIGARKDPSLVARKLLSYRQQLVVSPAYLASCKAPETPQDLLSHQLLAFSNWTPEKSWTFVHENGEDIETLVFQPHLSMNDFTGLACATLAGTGIGHLPPIVQPELLRSGRLVEVMPKWRFRTLDLSMVRLGNRHIPRPVRVFGEFAAQMAPAMFPDLPV